jgi:hypothetical protein
MMVKSWERNNPTAVSTLPPAAEALEERALSKGLKQAPGLPIRPEQKGMAVHRADQQMPHALPKGPAIQGLNRDRLTVQTRGGTE